MHGYFKLVISLTHQQQYGKRWKSQCITSKLPYIAWQQNTIIVTVRCKESQIFL